MLYVCRIKLLKYSDCVEVKNSTCKQNPLRNINEKIRQIIEYLIQS